MTVAGRLGTPCERLTSEPPRPQPIRPTLCSCIATQHSTQILKMKELLIDLPYNFSYIVVLVKVKTENWNFYISGTPRVGTGLRHIGINYTARDSLQPAALRLSLPTQALVFFALPERSSASRTCT